MSATATVLNPSHCPADVDPAEAIYQPFFKGGIALVLTLGAAWGAALLLRIALLGSFTAVGLQEVNAHGHAQIFGWVGLFVMGFAYQQFPRFKQVALAYPRLARLSFALMLGGIVLRSGLQPLVGHLPWTLIPAAAGSIVELAAIGLFLFVIVATFRRSLNPTRAYEFYIFAALAWFAVQGVYDTVYFVATALAPTRDHLLTLTATWQAPLREMQIHGFAMLMIFGVSQKILPAFYRFPEVPRRRSLVLLASILVGLAAQCTGFVLMRTAGHAWAALWYSGVLLMAGSSVVFALSLGLHRQALGADRSLKFIRTGYGWLLFSLLMLVLLPAYQFGLLRAVAPESHAAQIGFSHAYYGAIRHAITVGFISLMIVGVSAKVVPMLKGIPGSSLTSLWLPFALLNLGCFLRVSMQTLTDFNTAAFPVAGVSGLLEVTALALWGFHLWKVMNAKQGPMHSCSLSKQSC
ncbi:MAG: NnrS family protein [FCB group bacterium]|jgi:hypothetical protein|nr:NnrS family protein [FCB group bacterium]